MDNDNKKKSLNIFHLRYRSLQKEKLDNLTLGGQILHQTLSELNFINRFLGNYRAMEKAIFKIIENYKKQPFHIIDIGCGGGDMLLFLAKTLKKRNVQATFLGIDGNANSIDFAIKNATDFSEIKFIQADILSNDFQLPICDILICSHFLYHFDNQQIPTFLKRHATSIKFAFVASELERSRFAFWGFNFFSRLLGLSQLTREDGLIAIRRAFTRKELIRIFATSNWDFFSIKREFLFRLILTLYFVPYNNSFQSTIAHKKRSYTTD